MNNGIDWNAKMFDVRSSVIIPRSAIERILNVLPPCNIFIMMDVMLLCAKCR